MNHSQITKFLIMWSPPFFILCCIDETVVSISVSKTFRLSSSIKVRLHHNFTCGRGSWLLLLQCLHLAVRHWPLPCQSDQWPLSGSSVALPGGPGQPLVGKGCTELSWKPIIGCLFCLLVVTVRTVCLVNPLKPKPVWMLFKNSVHTSKRTLHFTITKINWLTLFKFNPLKTKLV
jgi:hypothetical protein